MKAYVIGKERMKDLVSRVKEDHRVFGPVGNAFQEFESVYDLRLDGARLLFGPKKLFFKEIQEVFRYDSQGNITDMLESEKTAVIGARVCDVRALRAQDRYFGENNEPFYMTARENTRIIGVTCTEPVSSCFCTQFGGLDNSDLDYDIWLTDIGHSYLAEAGSEWGEGILEGLGLELATPVHTAEKERLIMDVEAKIGWRPIDGDRIFRSFRDKVGDEYWHTLAEKCFACGKCNMICPTCHCYDIHDESGLDGSGARIRTWDSCHLFKYGLVAGGHNFRGERLARVQYRVYDKFYYPMERYNEFACVGCGRCFDVCNVDIDLRDILHHIAGGEE